MSTNDNNFDEDTFKNSGSEEDAMNEKHTDEVCDEHIESAAQQQSDKAAYQSAQPSTDFIMFNDPAPDAKKEEAQTEPNFTQTPPQNNPYAQGMNEPQDYNKNNYNQANYNQTNYSQNPYNQQGYSQNGYKVPPPPQYAQNGWTQEPPQSPKPPLQNQTQWTFNDYGPMQPNYTKVKPPKPPKKPKKPHSPSFGIKVFAVIISVLFVITAAGFGGYIVYDLQKTSDQALQGQDNKTTQQSTPEDKASSPSLNVGQTPDKAADKDKNGVLSGREINDKVSPSVVGVAVYQKTTGFQLAGQGSGIIMTADGYVITNAHVVSSEVNNGEIVKVEVILQDGNTYDAKIIGADLKTDLAVLKISATGLTPAEFGDSDKLSIGDDVFVIGNPSGVEFAGSFTKGTVSSLSRSIYMQQLGAEIEYIQTDAAINPGNSGGAFINEYGQVVGISSAKINFEGYEGMGFAIPINNAKDVVDSLLKNGYVAGRPKIGIQYKPVGETVAQLNGIPNGLRVYTVEPDSDAYKQGVKEGDIISKMGGIETYDAVTIAKALKGKKPGDSIVLTVYRVENGRASTFDVKVVLGEMAS